MTSVATVVAPAQATEADALELVRALEQVEAENRERVRGLIEEGERSFAEGRFITLETDADIDAFFDALETKAG